MKHAVAQPGRSGVRCEQRASGSGADAAESGGGSGKRRARSQRPPDETHDAGETDGERRTRPRTQAYHGSYDEVCRRSARETCVIKYLDRGGQRKRGAATMVVGTATVERIVRGKYDWRDRDLPAPRRR